MERGTRSAIVQAGADRTGRKSTRAEDRSPSSDALHEFSSAPHLHVAFPDLSPKCHMQQIGENRRHRRPPRRQASYGTLQSAQGGRARSAVKCGAGNLAVQQVLRSELANLCGFSHIDSVVP